MGDMFDERDSWFLLTIVWIVCVFMQIKRIIIRKMNKSAKMNEGNTNYLE